MALLIRNIQMLRVISAVLALAALLRVVPAQAEAVHLDEQKIKAGLVYNYLKYTSWPVRGGGGEGKYLSVCLYGGDAFGGALDPLDGRTAQQYTIHITRLSSSAGIANCDLLYIDRSQESNLGDILKTAGKDNIFTMSDIANFARRGGMVGFSMQDQRIHMAINKRAAEQSGITIQPRMLRLGEVVAP